MNDLRSPQGVYPLPPFEVHRYALVASTQDTLRSSLETPPYFAGPGSPVVWADEQDAGRGRQGRRWDCPAGEGLLFSVQLRPGLPLELAPLWGLNLALLVAEVVESLCPGFDAWLKWPNDWVTAEGRKWGGLLIENQVRGSFIQEALVGLGINLTQKTFKGLPDATSLALEQTKGSTGHRFSVPDQETLLHMILRAWAGFANQTNRAIAVSRPIVNEHEILGACERRLWGLGQSLRFEGPKGSVFFTVLGLERNGGLRVWDSVGSCERILGHPEYRLCYGQAAQTTPTQNP